MTLDWVMVGVTNFMPNAYIIDFFFYFAGKNTTGKWIELLLEIAQGVIVSPTWSPEYVLSLLLLPKLP